MELSLLYIHNKSFKLRNFSYIFYIKYICFWTLIIVIFSNSGFSQSGESKFDPIVKRIRDSSYTYTNIDTISSIKLKGIQYSQKNNLQFEFAFMIIDMAREYQYINDFENCLKYLKIAKPILEQLKNNELWGDYYSQFGTLVGKSGDYKKSSQYFLLSAENYKKANLQSLYLASSFNYNLAKYKYEGGAQNSNLNEIITNQSNYVNYAYQIKDTQKIIYGEIALASFYTDFAQFDNAKKHLMNAKRISDIHNNTSPYLLLTMNSEFGRVNLYTSNYKESIKNYHYVLEQYSFVDKFYITYLQRLSEGYAGIGDFKNATKYYKKLYFLNDSIKQIDFKNQALDFEIKYETVKKEQKNIKLEKENLKKDEKIKQDKSTRSILIISIVASLTFVTLFCILFYSLHKKNKLLSVQKVKIDKQNDTLKQLNKELTATTDELIESNAYKNKLFSIISHDISSPLRAVTNYITGLEADKIHLSTFHKIQSTLVPIENMASNLLQWSILQNKSVELKKESINIYNLIQEISDIYKLSMDSKSIQIVNQINSDYQMTADRNTLTIALRNIISNCIKYSYKNSSIKIYENNRSLVIEDNGIGMDENAIKIIYLNNDIESTIGTNNETGTGLGLRLVNDCLKLNELNLIIESEKNMGSKFIITQSFYS